MKYLFIYILIIFFGFLHNIHAHNNPLKPLQQPSVETSSDNLYAESCLDNFFAAEIYFKRGMTRLENKLYESAIADFSKAISLNNYFFEAYAMRGIAISESGFPEEAVIDYDFAIEINPFYAKAYFLRGQVNSLLGRQDEARSDFDLAVYLNPEYACLMVNQ